jgi:hypothetical protein
MPSKVKSAKTEKEYGVLGDRQFGIRLNKFTTKVELHLRQKIAHVFLEAFVDIVDGTPVDTTRAQSSWKCTVPKKDTDNSENAKYIDPETGEFKVDEAIVATYPKKSEVIETGAKNLWRFLRYNYKTVKDKRSKGGYSRRFTKFVTRGPIHITNTVPYLAKLEGGASEQNALWIKQASDEISRKLKEPRTDCQNFYASKYKPGDSYIEVKDKDKASFNPFAKPELVKEKDTKYVDKQPEIETEESEEDWWKRIASTDEGKKFLKEEKQFEKFSRNMLTGGQATDIEGKSAFTRSGQVDAGRSTTVIGKGPSRGETVSLKPEKNKLWNQKTATAQRKKETKVTTPFTKREVSSVGELSKRKAKAPQKKNKTAQKQSESERNSVQRKPRRIRAKGGNVFDKWQREMRKNMAEPTKDKSKGGFWKPNG